MAEDIERYMTTEALKKDYEYLTGIHGYCSKTKRVDSGLYTVSSRAVKIKKAINTVFENIMANPKPVKDNWAMKRAMHLLEKYKINLCIKEKKCLECAIGLAIRVWVQKDPAVALEYVKKYGTTCSCSALDEVYRATKDKECLNIMATKLEEEFKEKEPEDFYDEVLLYRYAFEAKNKDLLKKSMVDEPRTIQLDEKTFQRLKEDVDYKPFFEHLKHSGVEGIYSWVGEIDEFSDLKVLKDLISGHDSLKKVEGFLHGVIPAETFLPNEQLQTITLSLDMPDAEKLLEQLPNLVNLDIKETGGVMMSASDVYASLMAHKPEKLELVSGLEATQATDLMKKYADLCVPSGGEGLCERNKTIIKAKKTRKMKDIIEVVKTKGFVEYLKLTNPKDRPTKDDLNKKYIRRIFCTGEQEDLSCFDIMRTEYKKNYFDVLSEVSDLCGFPEIKKEIELVKAVREKRVIEYLKQLPPEEMPKYETFSKPLPITLGNKSLSEEIKEAYGKEYPQLIMSILKIGKATSEDAQAISQAEGLEKIPEMFEKQRKRTQASDAAKAAFEKWKENHGKEN